MTLTSAFAPALISSLKKMGFTDWRQYEKANPVEA